jgi:predicted heme/steroid binding protein
MRSHTLGNSFACLGWGIIVWVTSNSPRWAASTAEDLWCSLRDLTSNIDLTSIHIMAMLKVQLLIGAEGT